MEIAPRYDAQPIITMDGPPDAIRTPMVRQRRRLLAELGDLDDAQWRSPSRCEGWSVQDVVTHLVSTDGFWTASVSSGVAGQPTRFLQGFDPQASPAALVEHTDPVDPGETLAAFAASSTALCDVVEELDDAGLVSIGEAPPGHVSMHVVLHHALWDCWVHERDILVPLGIDPVEEDDEVLACLRYAAALAPAFSLLHLDPDHSGELAVSVTEPDTSIRITVAGTVEVRDEPAPAGTPVVEGRAVDVVEGLSVRAPLVHDLGPDDEWLLAGLLTVFDR